VIMTLQPCISGGSLSFQEIPAGVMNDSGTFAGTATREILEKTGLKILEDELINMTRLAIQDQEGSTCYEKLQAAMYLSVDGCDEYIPIFLCEKEMP
jgi:ADP-sugar diphosphatase